METSSQSSEPDLIDDADKQVIDYQRPLLYPKQEEAIFYPRDSSDRPARFSCIEAGTKTGKTVGCICWLYEKALFGPKGNYWWVAPVSSQAKIAYTRMKDYYHESVTSLLTPTPTLTLPNGNIIWFKSGEDPDNLYGEDVQAFVIDEASRLREEAWHAVRSTLTATRGHGRFIGNVKGRRNWFFDIARRAEKGEPGYSYHRIVAADAVFGGVLDAAEIEEAKRDLPDHVFKELYLAEASDDGGNPFGIKEINAAVKALSNQPTVCFGIDLAKHSDWTVVTGLDIAGDVTQMHRWQLPWNDTMNRIRSIVKKSPALVDSTGVGDPILEMLQTESGTKYEGYVFSSPSKQKLMEGLALAIQQKQTSVVAGDGKSKSVHHQEMESFEYVHTRTGVRYSAPEGYHDDTVCSHALAVEHKVHARAPLIIPTDVLARSRLSGRSLRTM